MDFMLLEHDMFGRPNLLVWGGYVILVLWSCTDFQNGSLTGMQYGYGTLGIIAYPFAGLLIPKLIFMVNNDEYALRRARRVRWFLGRE